MSGDGARADPDPAPCYAAAFEVCSDIGRLAAARIARGATFISLGQNCTTARYLQATGARSAAYPFDWIFSSPEIVEDCIGDGFAAYLDRSAIVSRTMTTAGHARYHAHMFNHRSPLVGDNADYYRRCATRFMTVFRSDAPIVFVSTSLPEHARRPGWSRGFVQGFAAPENQDAVRDYGGLSALFARRAAPTGLIVVEQRTCRERPLLEVVEQREHLMVIRFDACGASDGIDYRDPRDDALCRTLYAEIARPGA